MSLSLLFLLISNVAVFKDTSLGFPEHRDDEPLDPYFHMFIACSSFHDVQSIWAHDLSHCLVVRFLSFALTSE